MVQVWYKVNFGTGTVTFLDDTQKEDMRCKWNIQTDAEMADSFLLDEMVYLIARGNEAEGFIQETGCRKQSVSKSLFQNQVNGGAAMSKEIELYKAFIDGSVDQG